MYKLPDGQLDIYEVYSPLYAMLDPGNRWIRWASMIPWRELEREWSARLYARRGAPAKPMRYALGALLIQEKLRLSDRECIRQLTENPYWQYFIGLQEFSNKAPFHDSFLTDFRRRLPRELRQTLSRYTKEIMR